MTFREKRLPKTKANVVHYSVGAAFVACAACLTIWAIHENLDNKATANAKAALGDFVQTEITAHRCSVAEFKADSANKPLPYSANILFFRKQGHLQLTHASMTTISDDTKNNVQILIKMTAIKVDKPAKPEEITAQKLVGTAPCIVFQPNQFAFPKTAG